MASKLINSYKRDVEDTRRKVKKNFAEQRNLSHDTRVNKTINPDSRDQKKNIKYVMELTEQPKRYRKDWEKAGDCCFFKSTKQSRKDLTSVSGGDHRIKTDKGPSGDHRTKRSTRIETASQTSATTKYVQITPDMIHQNEILLSKLKRNEELLQQIKKHKYIIQLLKRQIRNAVSEHAIVKAENGLDQLRDQSNEEKLKNKSEPKDNHEQKQLEGKPSKITREKLVSKKQLELVQHCRTIISCMKENVRRHTLPNIKERPEPDDVKIVKSLSKGDQHQNGMDKRLLRTMCGTTIKRQTSKMLKYKNDRPISPRRRHTHCHYMPLSLINPNALKRGISK